MDMREPTISIIVPAYNVASYIEAALESLASQTLPPHEVIIVDDGSEDDTWERLRAFPHPYRVELIATVNQGQGRARNLGIASASGDYVYFFDADDLLESDFIEQMHALITSTHYPDIIFFSGAAFFDEGAKGLGLVRSYRRGFEGEYTSAADLLAAFERHGGGSCSPCLYLSKRMLWGDRLGFKAYYHEDEQVFYPLIFSARRHVVTDRVLFRRRIRHNSTMTMAKCMKHVKGLHGLLGSLLELYRDPAYRSCRRHIRKRALQYTGQYMGVCRKVRAPYDLSLLLALMLGFRNRSMCLKIVFHALSDSLRIAIKRLMGRGKVCSH
ncbi:MULTISPECIES: glycosyltransferase family 2 protein [Halomonadaceae]|jgi:glycosyltransferase involved in cell wall biosynthesis|uniref:Glycosyltransferase family 2 protein n=1 Tax=Billgrantia aerodenitrificans TaxID=2733483 RepID=A0ABS9AS99_9GAMM|nr:MULTISPECIES: glycosyltransferase family A protein [Halomonas]MCE8024616.1 glycosyltransferase family 2 protein [Halomonas aerodenitrificans]MCE8038230.1 glycosyltransferase family 2 protein [Halomonas sp. MCCC 1A11062]